MSINHTIAILAYNQHEVTMMNIKHLVSLGYSDNILLFDNGSKPGFREAAASLNIRYHREEQNIYVNPAWNKIIQQEDVDYLTLLNNDCFILSKNYFEEILYHMQNNNIHLSTCKTKNIQSLKTETPRLKQYFRTAREHTPLKWYSRARRQGWLMTLNLNTYKKLQFQIPDYIKVWHGDNWIWGQFLLNKYQIAVYKNRYAIHLRSLTTQSEKIKNIIDEDNKNMVLHGNWIEEVSPLVHIKTRWFHRYA